MTYLELFAPPRHATVEPLRLGELGEPHHGADVGSQVDLVVGAGQVQLHGSRGPEERDRWLYCLENILLISVSTPSVRVLSYLVTEEIELFVIIRICQHPGKLTLLRQEVRPVMDSFKQNMVVSTVVYGEGEDDRTHLLHHLR